MCAMAEGANLSSPSLLQIEGNSMRSRSGSGSLLLTILIVLVVGVGGDVRLLGT